MMQRKTSWTVYLLAAVVFSLLVAATAALPLLICLQSSAAIQWNQPLAERVVAEVSKRMLKPDANGMVVLPVRYASVSKTGRVYVSHRGKGLTVILFPLWTGKGGNVDGYLFCNRSLAAADTEGGDNPSSGDALIELRSFSWSPRRSSPRGVPQDDLAEGRLDRQTGAHWYHVHWDLD
jgi:hypothetical protein